MPCSTDNIKVAIRVRPFIAAETNKNLCAQWCVQNNNIYQIDESGQRNEEKELYSFDHVFQMSQNNKEIYDEVVKDFVDSALNGLNSTIFAYGQTSSGKTYTMLGGENDEGLVPLAIDNIFNTIDNCDNRKFLTRVSYVEIYNEKINDLLDPRNRGIKIREHYSGTISLNKVKEEIVSSREQVYECLKLGNENRHIGGTNMNDRSSRSHTIFKIVIESAEICDFESDDCPVQISNLNLVDLAGSERVAQTKATGVRLKEGGHINKSLSALGLVIRQLSDGQEYVNFRDSKLTRLLQHSLGGNAKTLIIATITLTSVECTSSTLSFAQRAKAVKNKPHINEILTDSATCKRYAQLNLQLQQRLDELSKNLEVSNTKQEESSKEILRLQEQMQMLEIFRHGTKSDTTTIIPKRRHTIGHLGQKCLLKAIVEEPEEGVQSVEGVVEDRSPKAVGDLTTPISLRKPEVLSTFSTPKRNLRIRIQALQKDYEELVTYTRDEKTLLAETSQEVEKLEGQLREEKRKLRDYQKVRKVEEELIANHLNSKFKIREEQLLDRIASLEEELNSNHSCNGHDSILSRDSDNPFLNGYPLRLNDYDEIKYLRDKLILVHEILEHRSLTETFERTFNQSKFETSQEIIETKTSEEIIESEIWKQIDSFDQIIEELRELLPNEIESCVFENGISVELLNNNSAEGLTEHVKILFRIYESLIRKNELIRWFSKKILSLQEEQKVNEDKHKHELDQFKSNIDELNLFIQTKDKNLNELRSTVCVLEDEVKGFKDKSAALASEVRKYEENKSYYEEAIVRYETESGSKEEFNIQIQQLEKHNDILRNKINCLESQLRTTSFLEDEVKALKENSDALTSEIRRYEKDKSYYEETITRYETENSALKHDMKRTEEEFNVQIQRLEKDNDILRNRVNCLESQLSTTSLLENEVKALKENSDALTNEIRKYQNKESCYEETVTRYKTENSTLKLDMKRTKEEFNTQIQQLEKDNNILRNRINCLESQLSTTSLLEKEVKALKENSEALTNEIGRYEQNKSYYEETIAQYERENSTLKLDVKRTIDEFNMQIQQLEKDNDILRSRVNCLESQLNVSEHKLLECSRSKEGLVLELEKARILTNMYDTYLTKIKTEGDIKYKLSDRNYNTNGLETEHSKICSIVSSNTELIEKLLKRLDHYESKSVHGDENDVKVLTAQVYDCKKRCSTSQQNISADELGQPKTKLECTLRCIIEHFIQEARDLLLKRYTPEEREHFKLIRREVRDFHRDLKSQLQLFQNQESYNLDDIKSTLLKFCRVSKEYSNLEKSFLKTQIRLLDTDNKTYLQEISVLTKAQEVSTKSCPDCDSLKIELSNLNNRLISKERMLTETLNKLQGLQEKLLTRNFREEDSCLKCNEYKKNNIEIQKALNKQIRENYKLQIKMDEEREKKVEIKHSETMNIYKRHIERLRKEVQEYEDARKNRKCVDVQCNLLEADGQNESVVSAAQYKEMTGKYLEVQEKLEIQTKKVDDYENSSSLLQKKYQELKRLCQIRRTEILELRAKDEKNKELIAQFLETQRQLEMQKGIGIGKRT